MRSVRIVERGMSVPRVTRSRPSASPSSIVCATSLRAASAHTPTVARIAQPRLLQIRVLSLLHFRTHQHSLCQHKRDLEAIQVGDAATLRGPATSGPS